MKILAAISILLLSTPLLACPKVSFKCNSNYPVHLSFDDGPHRNTDRVLWILKQENVKASFFPLGRKLVNTSGNRRRGSEKNFKILDKMKRAGHTIGTHTYTHIHHFNHLKGTEEYKERIIIDNYGIDWRDNIDITRDSKALAPYLMSKGKLYFRLPYGQGWYEAERQSKRNTEVLEHLLDPSKSDATTLHVGWDIDTNDWRYDDMKLTEQDDKKFLSNIAKDICSKKGGMVLMHDHTKMVSRNLTCLIKGLKKGGHKFSSIDSFKDKRVGSNGPKIVMGHKDIAGVDHRDCDSSSDANELQKNQSLLDQLIDRLRKNDEYTPADTQTIRGNIYDARDSNGKMKYKHVGTFTKYKYLKELTKSPEYRSFLKKNNLNPDKIVYFLDDKYKIQIGYK